nr:hypothetical protein [Tanacetum cinerariifolium]
MEDQPLHVDASSTALSTGYVADFNPEEDEEDPEEDPADGGDDDDNKSYDDDDDDDDDDVVKDEEDEEEDEHLALADPFVVPIDDLETMTTVNQGMSVEEIKRVVAQQVANAIKVISIYETKSNMAHKSMSQTKRQEDKVAENARNKRKWEAVSIRSVCFVKLRAPVSVKGVCLKLPSRAAMRDVFGEAAGAAAFIKGAFVELPKQQLIKGAFVYSKCKGCLFVEAAKASIRGCLFVEAAKAAIRGCLFIAAEAAACCRSSSLLGDVCLVLPRQAAA